MNSHRKMFVPLLAAAVLCLLFSGQAAAQKNRPKQIPKKPPAVNPTIPPEMLENLIKPKEIKVSPGTVVDERLAVLRSAPSLYATPIQRMSRGRTLMLAGSETVDGVLFYSVKSPDMTGWIQADAVVSTIRRGDDERLFNLLKTSEGFAQIEQGTIFLETFPTSPLRPTMLLFLGDLIQDATVKLTMDANKRFTGDMLERAGAPMHSYFLNFNGLDRYRKLGIVFLFNAHIKYFHYDGSYWKELILDFPKTNEAGEAKLRLETLKAEMEKTKQ